MRPIGIGLYPIAALVNHSCVPNCVAIFSGSELRIRAIRPIKPGDEITISYTEIGDSTQERQKELLNHFYFKCNCVKCQDEELNSIVTGYLCQNKQCRGLVNSSTTPLNCSKCSGIVDKNYLLEIHKKAKDICSQAQSLKGYIYFPVPSTETSMPSNA